MPIGAIIGLSVGIPAALIIGIIIGFAIGQKMFKKQLKENPPMSKEQIKNLYRQIGRTPSENELNRMMESMKKQSK